jgi:hypothetical protein
MMPVTSPTADEPHLVASFERERMQKCTVDESQTGKRGSKRGRNDVVTFLFAEDPKDKIE